MNLKFSLGLFLLFSAGFNFAIFSLIMIAWPGVLALALPKYMAKGFSPIEFSLLFYLSFIFHMIVEGYGGYYFIKESIKEDSNVENSSLSKTP